MQFRQLECAKSMLIYGYGTEGQASQKFLQQRFKKADIEVFDDAQPEISTTRDLSEFDVIVVSPGISRERFSVQLHDKLTSQVEIFFHNLTEIQRQKIIGVTGTKGKSTTTKLISEVLANAGKKVLIGGNFGVPVLSFYDTLNAYDFAVLELSSYQLEFLDISPHVAIFTNFYNDHMDRHYTVEAYFEAKSHIFSRQIEGDITIVSTNHESFLPPFSQTIVQWSLPSKLILAKSLSAEYFPQSSTFRAPHLLQNLGLVQALCVELEIPESILKKTTMAFAGLEHRLEYVDTKFGIAFINDANATTPDASVAAMQFVGDKLGSVIVGGLDRGYDFSQMVDAIIAKNCWVIVLKSTAGDKVMSLLAEKKYAKIQLVYTMPEIVRTGFEVTPRGKTCLLSMGSPSYGYFKNFEEKGTLFKQLIRQR